MAIIAKGNAAIVINREETEAKLVFTPDAEGLGWDVDAVIKLARDQGLSPLPAPASLEQFIQKASRSKVPMETVVVEGLPPEPTTVETVGWESLAIPEDVAAFKEEALGNAPAPELFRIRIEKVKRDTLVKKPGKFPFMPAKEEIVSVWDKKEIREEVSVESESPELRYAERNSKLGTITPSKPGKPGKSVFARPLAPPMPADTNFYLGKGIRREKGDLLSEYTGFIRIGPNWADIIPLAKPSWEITTGSDNVTLFFKFLPGDKRFPIPRGEDILGEAKKLGAEPGSLVEAGEIDDAVADSMKSGEELLAFSLFTVQEAEARVDISPDDLRAELYLRKGIAGARPLEMKAISQVIRDSQVQGFNVEELKTTIRTFMDETSAALVYVMVEGKTATRGADKEVQLLAQALEEEPKTVITNRFKEMKIRSDASQGFPITEAEQMCIVEKGMKLAQVSQPPNGEQGQDVYGRLIPGLPGNDPELKLFRGLHQQGSDIAADISGLLLVKGSGKIFWGTIIDYRDAGVRVQVSPDAMEASAEIFRGLGPGQPLTKELVLKALAEAGVVRGINNDTVETACKMAALKGSTSQVLARGEPPLAAGGTAVHWLIPIRAGGEPQPGEERANSGAKCSVTQGMALAELIETEENKTGFDVRGKELSAEDGVSSITWDASIIVKEAEGKKKLFAKFGGDLFFDGSKLSISSLKGIKGDVGEETGNIDFSGEVRITGKVQRGFSVIGGKDVLVGGSVEAALISSGGKAVIVQGVNGAGRGVVRARTIETAFAEKATLLAVDDIKVVNRCISCNVKTNGRLILSGESGMLTGGICKARQGIHAAQLGAEERVHTEVSFGQDYLIKDQIEAAERELERTKAALVGIEKALKAASGTRLETTRAEKVRLLKLVEQLNLKVFTLRERFEEHHDSEILIKGMVYPGVVMESHDRYYEITEKRQGVVFYFNRETGRIMERNA